MVTNVLLNAFISKLQIAGTKSPSNGEMLVYFDGFELIKGKISNIQEGFLAYVLITFLGTILITLSPKTFCRQRNTFFLCFMFYFFICVAAVLEPDDRDI